MNKISFHILRVGLAITFLWIGFLILKEPEAWGGYLQPWAINLLPISIAQVMTSTAILDLAIGFFLLLNFYTWLFAFLAALHLIIVLITSGITDITVRDIGLLAAALALLYETWPKKWFKN